MVEWKRTTALLGLMSLCVGQQAWARPNEWTRANNTDQSYVTISLSENCCSFIYHTVLTISDGPAITSKAGEGQSLPPINGNNYSYTADNNFQTINMFGAFLGGQFQINPNYMFQLGFAYYQPTNFSVTGTTVQGPDASSASTYRYSYNINSQMYMVETKWLLNIGDYDEYHPYVLLGLGMSRNRSGSYTIQNPAFLTFSPIYTSNAVNAFTYGVGVGVDMDLGQNWRVGVGYRFADLGKSNLGSASIDTTPISGTLSQQHLYLNEVLASMSYLF